MSDQAKSTEPTSDPAAAPGPDSSAAGKDTADRERDSAAVASSATSAAANPDPSAPAAVSTAAAASAAADQGTPAADKDAAAANPSPAPAPAPPAQSSHKLRPSNVAIGLVLAAIGVVMVAVIILFTPTPTPDQNIPYLLTPLEKQLDAHIRYKPPQSIEHKDWRNDMVIEQKIWTDEVAKIMMGRPEAKPIEFKRDYLLYLGDSFFKDEPHFGEAKAAYLTANATARVPHDKGYDLPDAELWHRIGYCDIRMGFYDEAEEWLKKALQANEEASKGKTDLAFNGTHNAILDNLAENYSRKGEPQKAEEVVQQRLREIKQPNADCCVEVPLLFNMALAKEKEGDLAQSEKFYKLAIKQCNDEDRNRGVGMPDTVYDNNRVLARVLMNYSHMLRVAHRNDDAIAAMRRALCVYDNPPP